MFDFFDTILGYIEMLWSYVLGFIEALTFAVGSLSASMVIVPALVPYVPYVIGSAMTVFVSIYVAKFLLGR